MFEHFKNSTQTYESSVEQSTVSGGGNDFESGLDGLMQTIVCKGTKYLSLKSSLRLNATFCKLLSSLGQINTSQHKAIHRIIVGSIVPWYCWWLKLSSIFENTIIVQGHMHSFVFVTSYL